MKTTLTIMILIASLFGATQSFAAEYSLAKLDTLKTCKTELQQKNGNMALAFLEAFSWWNMKDQMNMIGDDYISWHASLGGLLASHPEYQGHVPFDMGQWTKGTYIQTMAFLAYANDLSQYIVTPERADCVGDDTVVLVTNFTGFQIRREEASGCVTHGLAFGSRTHLQVVFKDYATGKIGEAPQHLVSKSFSSLDDLASAKVREELAKIVGDPQHPNAPNVAPNAANCKTRAQILKEFQDQLNH